jgi:hypothetical protein
VLRHLIPGSADEVDKVNMDITAIATNDWAHGDAASLADGGEEF